MNIQWQIEIIELILEHTVKELQRTRNKKNLLGC